MATDRILVDCYDRLQMYGTQYEQGENNKLILVGKINLLEINSNRKNIGLNEVK